MTRRTLLKAAVAGVVHHLIPVSAKAHPEPLSGRIRICDAKTNETDVIDYLKDGRLRPEALIRLNRVFRYDTGAEHEVDPRLVVLLDTIHTTLKAGERPYLLLSGFRPPNRGRFSYHNVGMAADLQIEGVPLKVLRNAALVLQAGGVGSYTRWVHLDVGPVRVWGGSRVDHSEG